MEEHVGQWWHRFVTRLADTSYPQAKVTLEEMEKRIGMMFRAAGGDHSVRVAAAALSRNSGTRAWLQRVAGVNQRVALPVLDPQALSLPSEIAVFEEIEFNKDLYLWLSAMAAVYEDTGDWIADNRAASARVLQHFPGLRAKHERLVRAHLAQRPAIKNLKAQDAVFESAVQSALRCDDHNPVFVKPDQVTPVWLWMTANSEGVALMGSGAVPTGGIDQESKPSEKKSIRRRTRQVDNPNQRQAFILPSKVESILTWSEFVSADRGTDEEEDDFDSATVANDMDKLSVVRSEETVASKVRFDLDLPGATQDDLPVSAEFTLPEWDWRQKKMLSNHCGLRYFEARIAEPFVPSEPLKKTVRKLRRRLETLSAAPRWVHRCHDGDAIDTDAWVRYQSERCIGAPVNESPAVYIRRQNIERSLATLLLADLSLSTDAYATSEARVIDVIRDALYVFGEALSTTGDPFEVLGFSSIKRHQVRLQHLKHFDEPWNDKARARVGAIKPGYYTRMGAAIRAATMNLSQRGEQQRLLIILTDGKPNDLDIYEGRYGLEDTRQAIREARDQGLLPFCITIDEKAHDYMPYLFGKQGYALIHRPQELATRLTQVWASLVH